MADRYEDLRTYVAIIDHGGVNAAAAAMGLARSAASRRLSDLEARIGVTLIARTTRRFEPTAAGLEYLRRAREILAAIDELDGGFRTAFDGSTVTVSGSEAPAVAGVLPAIATFLRENAGSAVKLRIDANGGGDRDVSLSTDGEGVQVGEARRIVCAAPSYLSSHGTPASPEDLASHSAIATPHDAEEWRRVTGAPRPTAIVTAPDDALAAVAALAGIGIALLPEPLVAALVSAKALTEIDVGAASAGTPVRVGVGKDAGPAAALLADALARSFKS